MEEISTTKEFKRRRTLPFNKIILGDAIKELRKLLRQPNKRYISGIRNRAILTIKKPHKPKYVKFELNEEDKELIKKIMEEAREWEEAYNKIPFNEDQRYKFLSDCIRYLGHVKLSDLFSNANNNMMEFLTKTLRRELKENKEEKLNLSK
jgi:hypothetical protein